MLSAYRKTADYSRKLIKSYVTLNGSIRIGCVNVYIKDNMLLGLTAPPSHKSLKSLSEIINLEKIIYLNKIIQTWKFLFAKT